MKVGLFSKGWKRSLCSFVAIRYKSRNTDVTISTFFFFLYHPIVTNHVSVLVCAPQTLAVEEPSIF